MRRRRRNLTQPYVEKLIKEGRGQGEFGNYHPWMTVHDLSSSGYKVRVSGNTVNRIHHLFSKNEYNYFLILDFSPDVIDIREQYPLLPLEETFDISLEIGVPHPRDVKTKELLALTTDFLITVRGSNRVWYVPRTVKPASKLDNKRVIEKFEIERRYWARRGKELGIVTPEQLPRQLCLNLRELHGKVKYEAVEHFPQQTISAISTRFDESLFGSTPVVEVADACDKAFQLEPGDSLSVFWHFVANRRWKIDLYKRLETGRPLGELLRE